MPETTHKGLEILEFPDPETWERWLADHHDSSPGVWLKIAKKGASRATVSYAQALDGALCFGWIDGQKGAYDEAFWLQRFTRRGPRSKWSQVNREHATRLIEQSRMQPAGLAQVRAAQGDGRWAAAYEPQSRATVPPDFQAELDRNPEAKAFFETLKGARRYAFCYRIADAKRPQTRAKRIADYIALLNEGRTLHD
jgi:uncharacterized protein YdeI (YjbR/CyaY-like superfamily)